MTASQMTERAQKIWDAYIFANHFDMDSRDTIASVLREVINQLQQSPGVIMCADVLELCDELEGLS